MSTITEALREGTIAWKAEGDDWVLHGDGEELARIDEDLVTLEGRRFELAHGRGYVTLVDAASGAREATMRLVGHHTGIVGQVTLAGHHLRISKQRVNPFLWQITDGLGGPQLYRVLRFGGQVRIRGGKDLTDQDRAEIPADIVALLVALTTIPELTARSRELSRAA